MQIPFIKIQGLGNDYVFISPRAVSKTNLNLKSLARKISDRSRGVGSDGMIVVGRVSDQSASMTIYNKDGSRAEICGNGLRAAALYIRYVSKTSRRRFVVFAEGERCQTEIVKGSRTSAIVKASWHAPSFNPEDVGLSKDLKNCLGIPLVVDGKRRSLYCLALPNPQAVIFVDNFDFDWQKEGKLVEKSRLFRNGVNVMFTRVESVRRISIKPWERGSGATASCATGAAAATVVSTLLGYTRGTVTAMMPGGRLTTRWDISENKIYQEGPTSIVFSGSYFL